MFFASVDVTCSAPSFPVNAPLPFPSSTPIHLVLSISFFSLHFPPQPPPIDLKRSHRPTKPALWLDDYVSSKKPCLYPMTNYVCYEQLTPSYRASLAFFSTVLLNSNPLLKLARIWVSAKQSEIFALGENKTYFIVDVPFGQIPIGYKWLFKSNREIERYKTGLVAKGYS